MKPYNKPGKSTKKVPRKDSNGEIISPDTRARMKRQPKKTARQDGKKEIQDDQKDN